VILDSPNTSTATSLDSRTETLPSAYKLRQNYPNPFNPSTTISFTIPQRELVTLKIFDMTGREVATLLNETRFAGEHHIVWNGTNYLGNKVASGVYVYVMITPTQRLSRTMTFLK